MLRKVFSIYVWISYGFIFLLFFIAISITFLFTFPFDKYHKIPNKVLSKMAWCMMRISPGWKINIKGSEKFDSTKPTIFIANHESFLDIPLLFQLPWRMKWVVKHSMTYIPVMGWMVKLTGQLTINRSSKSAIKKLSNLVKPINDLVPVMIFPEGTRSLDGEVKSFKNGAFLMALEHGFNIQPIVIEGAHEVLKSGSKLLNPKGEFKLSVLDAIDPKDFNGLSELKAHSKKLILEEQQRLKSN